jgi:sulfoxide reductase heme-binding subunit YedZ
MIGVAACAYGLIHLSLYATDEAFDLAKVASEIVLRIYLTIGFTALLGLCTLAATSTDGMVRRLGARRWQKLHRIAYGIALLAVIHFCMQSKLFLWEPMVMAGIYAWLMGCRAIAWTSGSKGRLPLWSAAVMSAVAAIGTALGEAFYYWVSMGAPFLRVLMVNLTLDTGWRPAWAVLASTGAVILLGAARSFLWPPRKARLRPA